jgi:uncharacterized protein YecT (DUF1311 family)
MIRTILITATLLAAAGAAHADTMKVSLTGKSEATVKADVYKASEAVCRNVAVAEYTACVNETYQGAMNSVAKVKATKLATLTSF